jgi:mannose-6-phosphate isomerase-like protein (cupin superfamily)
MLYKYSDKKNIFNDGKNTGYELAHLEHFTVVELLITSNLEAHEVPFEMTFYVIDGTGKCIIENEDTIVQKGDVLEVGSGLSRGWEIINNSPLKLLAIRK